MNNITIFASGAGSNAQKIIDHFEGNTKTKVRLIVCNNANAGVLTIAAKENIPALLIEKEKFQVTGYIEEIRKQSTDLIVLAGFPWKIPPVLINAFPHGIINIHPALLPAYGGKGMYGHAVHAAVIAANEKKSGITIHYVDEKYDHGETIFQAICNIDDKENPESLSQKIHLLEHEHYPKIIEKILDQKEFKK